MDIVVWAQEAVFIHICIIVIIFDCRIAAPMTRLTRKEVKFEWDDRCEEAFQELKRRLTSAPILIVPDRGQGHTVYCDASRPDWVVF